MGRLAAEFAGGTSKADVLLLAVHWSRVDDVLGQAGDLVPLNLEKAGERDEVMLPSLDLAQPARFRVILGPQDDYFTPAGLRTLLEATYTLSPSSDRMGMRLEGPPLEHSSKGYNIVSDGTAHGSIQVPGNGLPIILLADRQTTGGYPKIAAVISAAIPALGRLTPGAKVTFEAVDIETAEAALSALR
jgi:allophanate hydrolase subunit 2